MDDIATKKSHIKKFIGIPYEDLIAWVLFALIILFGCLKIGQDLTKIRKDIILQAGSLIFAILYGTFLNLWNSKDFFYRGLGRSTFLIYCFVVGALILYLGFYILINNRFDKELSFWWSIWALIGFILIMPLVNAMILFTLPLRER